MPPRMLQMTITQMRRKWPLVTMKSTLTRCELRMTKTISRTRTSAATMALAPRFESGGAEDPCGVPGAPLPPRPGELLLASGQPALIAIKSRPRARHAGRHISATGGAGRVVMYWPV